jgi:hypothetical protein
MQRIETIDKQFHNINKITKQGGTVITAEWLNAIQEELANTIEGLGATLSLTNSNQLYMVLMDNFLRKSVYDTNDDGKVNFADQADTVPWTGITGVPSSLPAGPHTHTFFSLSDVPDTYTDMAGRIVAIKQDISGVEFNSSINITSDGRLKISGSLPAIFSGVAANRLLISGSDDGSDSGGGAIYLRDNTSPTNVAGIELFAGGQERVRINFTGNFLLGSPTDVDSGIKLQVTGTAGITSKLKIASSTTDPGDGIIFHDTTLTGNELGSLRSYKVDASNAGLTIFTRSSGTTSEKIRVLPSGNVGIGITNPTDKLSVSGNISTTGTIVATGEITGNGITLGSRAASGNVVPYTGATSDINLGARMFTTTGSVTAYNVTSSINGNTLSSRAADSAVVHNTGNETIAGIKTFSDNIISAGTMSASGIMTASSFNSITGLSIHNPVMDSTSYAGVSTFVSRDDHVHPSDSSRASASQAFYIGTTLTTLNRSSGAQTLAGLTLTTPNIGVATGTSFNSITGLSSSSPLMDAAAASGTSTLVSRQDHCHPSDNARVPYIGASTNLTLGANDISARNFIAAGTITSSTGAIGYAAGNGGTVTQSSSKSTGVTLDKRTGTITMNSAVLGSQTTVSFTFTNNNCNPASMMLMTHQSGGTMGAYNITPYVDNGYATVYVRNVHTASLSEAIVIRFIIFTAVPA